MSDNPEQIVYLNGEFLPETKARISPFDHGFLYGDGLFDTCRAHNGYIFKLDQHVDRFFRSAKGIHIDLPLSKSELKNAVAETVRRNLVKNAYIRIVASIGIGKGLGMRRTVKTKPTILIFAIQTSGGLFSYDTGLKGNKAIIASIRSVPPGCGPEPRSKHNNYLNHVLTDNEAVRQGVDIAINLDIHGYVTECEGANVFIVKNKTIITPDLHLGLLEGITRETVFEISKNEGYEVKESTLTSYDIFNADEVFASSTVGGIIPIIEVDGRSISDGKIGPITHNIARAYNTMLENGVHGTRVFE